MKSRDNFPSEVINTVKLQSAYICANPDCRKLTVAPSLINEMKVQYVGKVAHISGAAINGPRYLPEMSATDRMAIGNAIFLCSNCADMIDKNGGIDYELALLHSWKKEHYDWVLANLNKDPQSKTGSVNSKFQMGGITANTINIASLLPDVNENKLHDQQTFLRSDKIFNDQVMQRLFRSLSFYAECSRNDEKCLSYISEFYQKPSNSYLNPLIEASMLKFVSKAESLLGFINCSNFDKWPYDQVGSNFTIQLRPEYLRDTQYRKCAPGDKEKWYELFEQLRRKLNAVKKYYELFRKIVKAELHV